MRTASLIMLSGLFVQVVHADETPSRYLSRWAPGPKQPEDGPPETKLTSLIEPAKHRDRAAAAGYAGSLRRRDRMALITQCIAFAQAHRCRRRSKPSTSSCGRLAPIARRWDDRSKV